MIVLSLASVSSAAVIVQYNFDNDVTHLDADVLATNISEIGPTSPDFALTVITESNLFAAEGQGVQDGQADEMAAAWAAEQYIEFTVNADGGYAFDLDTLTFDIFRGIRGTNDYAIRTSVDGFAENLVYRNQGTTATSTLQTVDFNAPSDFSGLGGTDGVGTGAFTASQFDGLSTITFRIAYDDRQNNNTGQSATRLDNWTVNGSVIAVPEPSSFAMLGLGIISLVSAQRRRS